MRQRQFTFEAGVPVANRKPSAAQRPYRYGSYRPYYRPYYYGYGYPYYRPYWRPGFSIWF